MPAPPTKSGASAQQLEPPARVTEAVVHDGFHLHASVHVTAHNASGHARGQERWKLSWPRPSCPDSSSRAALVARVQRAILVRGRLSGRTRIELDEPLDEVFGEAEVFVRPVG